MDGTRIAAELLEPIPANRTFGITVERAVDGRAEVALEVGAEVTNVIGSPHSSGLVAMVDAAGLAALISASAEAGEMRGVTPLGRNAQLEFLAPARGRLVATCALGRGDLAAARSFLGGGRDRGSLTTAVEIVDEAGVVVCRGSFDWSLRRRD
jgi:acyl-coenzyme A thioesterase PaaI-like protein